MISYRKESLIDTRSTRENRQLCDKSYPLSLGEMRRFFGVVVKELGSYQLFDASPINCAVVTATQVLIVARSISAKRRQTAGSSPP